MSFHKILVTTDLSEPSLNAVRRAGEIARESGGSLTVVYVVENRLPPLVLAHPSIDELQQQHRDHAESELVRTVARNLPDQDVETIVVEGTPHEEVIRLARDREVDLIVVGMHGHGFLVHALSGSTAERILHHASCPVLVVPEETN